MKRFAYLCTNIIFIITWMVMINQLLNYWYSHSNYNEFSDLIIESIHALYPIVIGVLLATPNLIKTLKNPGKVHYDFPRALVFGIPTLILALSNLIYLLSAFPLFSLIDSILLPLYRQNYIYFEVITMSGVILGYTLVTSVRKSENK